MEIKTLIEDEDAVSPVIGVILMVAITVILAAVIGTFVLGLGDQVSNTAPSASFTFDFTSDGGNGNCGNVLDAGDGTIGTLDITHDGGDQIAEDRLSIKDDDNDAITNLANCGGVNEDSDITSGDQVSPDVGSDDVVRVVWTAQGGGDSATLGKWTGPDA